jgi:hypothetical protein
VAVCVEFKPVIVIVIVIRPRSIALQRFPRLERAAVPTDDCLQPDAFRVIQGREHAIVIVQAL